MITNKLRPDDSDDFITYVRDVVKAKRFPRQQKSLEHLLETAQKTQKTARSCHSSFGCDRDTPAAAASGAATGSVSTLPFSLPSLSVNGIDVEVFQLSSHKHLRPVLFVRLPDRESKQSQFVRFLYECIKTAHGYYRIMTTVSEAEPSIANCVTTEDVNDAWQECYSDMSCTGHGDDDDGDGRSVPIAHITKQAQLKVRR